jgi:tellurite resistance protein
MPAIDTSLITKVIRHLNLTPSSGVTGTRGSILTAAASSYGFRADSDEFTQPSGFDPDAARLFEAIVESAYLVANADGQFDAAERSAFSHVVVAAAGGLVPERHLRALLDDLADLLLEDGLNKRVEMVGRAVARPEHAREVLRVAALLALVSGGANSAERGVMGQLSGRFGLDSGAVEHSLAEAQKALSA